MTYGGQGNKGVKTGLHPVHGSGVFGVRINLKKGERGRRVAWIGCTMEVPVVTAGEPEVVILGISKQIIDQVLTTLHTWAGGGMGAIKELKSTTSGLSWAGGVLPRLRWTTSSMQL